MVAGVDGSAGPLVPPDRPQLGEGRGALDGGLIFFRILVKISYSPPSLVKLPLISASGVSEGRWVPYDSMM